VNNHLYWRCRRGTKELDVLLDRYLRSLYPSASMEEKQAFDQLLRLPDDELADYLLGNDTPANPSLAKISHLITEGHR
jgi:antitoxin CptB